MHEITLSPHAASLSQSMRDIGYSLETSISDIIDNSISASSKTIHVWVDCFDTPHPCLAIVDDGSGMDQAEALEAMRLGSYDPRRSRDTKDLGRFGLGLKTASFSQCRSLTIISRKNNITFAAGWDLDLISQRNEWIVQVLSDIEIQALPFVDKLGEQGTLVLWRNLDRLLDGSSYIDKNFIYEKLKQLEQHLALIYHRYLSGEYGKHKIAILINGHPVEPFDPFCTTHKATQMLLEEIVRIDGQEIVIQPFILPHHSKLPKADYDYYLSRSDFISNQGAYVYRNGRLMAWGDWFKLIGKTEATKLARVRIDFSNALDEQWTIDIKKSRASPPPQVREKLQQIIKKITEQSRRVYLGRGERLLAQQTHPLWIRHSDRKGVQYGINREHPLLAAFADKADPQMLKAFGHILKVIESGVPIEAIYADYSYTPQAFEEQPDLPPEVLQEGIRAIAELFRTSGNLDKARLSNAILMVPPYSHHKDITRKIIEGMM
jgi:Histidine kinase-, DNA gyrase B-, and HSP90-like ATPase